MSTDYRWSLGTLIWLPSAGLLLLLCIAAAIACFIYAKKVRGEPYSDAGIAVGFGISALACAVLLIGGTAWGMWPYSAEYHQWRDTTGAVAEIDSRLLADGNGGATERFVVTFDDGLQRSCDDTRCTQVDEGDTLTLACKRAWQWSGTHGYDCNYVSHEATR